MNLYQEILLDHFKHPRHKGVLANADFSSGQHNPSCGDMVSMQGIVRDGHLAEVAFDGKGCVISMATASLLCEAALGQKLETITAYDVDFVLNLIGMQLGPNRLQCALLPLQALQSGVLAYGNK